MIWVVDIVSRDFVFFRSFISICSSTVKQPLLSSTLNYIYYNILAFTFHVFFVNLIICPDIYDSS